MQLILIFQHFLNRNHITNSKKNIAKHYDLSTDFFKCFLDETMMYSCAFYPNEQTTLHEAQKEKINKIIQGSDIKPGMRVLEIGSGWGSIAIELASHYNCHVTTVTISKEQFSYVKNKINEVDMAKIFYSNIHFDLNKVIFINNTRNTIENLKAFKKINTVNQSNILITSAFHMKRTMLISKELDLNIKPYAVDFRSVNDFNILNFATL